MGSIVTCDQWPAKMFTLTKIHLSKAIYRQLVYLNFLYSEKVECSHYAIAGNATVVNYQPLTIYLKNH